MSGIPRHLGPYREGGAFEEAWRQLASRAGADETIAGYSVDGRPIYSFELGSGDKPAVLLTALIHGSELIGSEALFHLVETLACSEDGRRSALLDQARLVILPILNPDALAENSSRLAGGHIAWQRGNNRGVDLNRNFPVVGTGTWLNPLAGSRLPWSPYYSGPEAFSEPETDTLRKIVLKEKPALSLGFHSFGNLLLYPWAYTKKPNPRESYYRGITRNFFNRVRKAPYKVMQSSHMYPILGDLDDWLETEFGTAAFTVEVSQLDCRLLNPKRLVNPFSWMNPTNVRGTVKNLTPGLVALMQDWLRQPAAL